MEKERKTRGWMDLVAIVAVLGLGYLAVAFSMGTFQPIGAVVSGSMEPVLSRGDLVVLRNVPPAELRVGDIAQVEIPRAYQEEFGLPPNNLHRITDIQQTGSNVQFITKGDANANIDPIPVAPDRVGGIVVADVPQVGHLFLFLNSPQGKIFALVMAISVFGYILYVGISDNWRNVVVAAQSGAGTLPPEAAEKARLLAEGAEPEAVSPTEPGAETPGIPPDRVPETAAPTLAAADLRLVAGVAGERLEDIESGITETRESLQHFSAAIAEYGTHLQSHTSTVRAMSTASQSLVEAVDRQNTVLERLETTLDREPGVTPPEEPQRRRPDRAAMTEPASDETGALATRAARTRTARRRAGEAEGPASRPTRRRASAKRTSAAAPIDFRSALRKVSAKKRPSQRKKN